MPAYCQGATVADTLAVDEEHRGENYAGTTEATSEYSAVQGWPIEGQSGAVAVGGTAALALFKKQDRTFKEAKVLKRTVFVGDEECGPLNKLEQITFRFQGLDQRLTGVEESTVPRVLMNPNRVALCQLRWS